MKLAFTLPDGSVTILGAAPKDQLERAVGTPKKVNGEWRRVLTDEEYKAFVISQNMAKGVIPAKAIDLVELPKGWVQPDRTFRAAWTKNGTEFGCDMVKAREIQRDRLRAQRAPLLEALDVEAVRALEAGNQAKLAEVTAEKQRLRDITALPEIDAAKTTDELKAIKV